MYHRMCIAFLITCITFLIKHVYNIPDPVYNIPDPVYNIPDHMGPLNCFLRRGFVDNLYDSRQILSEESYLQDLPNITWRGLARGYGILLVASQILGFVRFLNIIDLILSDLFQIP